MKAVRDFLKGAAFMLAVILFCATIAYGLVWAVELATHLPVPTLDDGRLG